MADFGAYVASRELCGRLGQLFVWPAVAAAWAGILVAFLRRARGGGVPDRPWMRPAAASAVSFACLLGGFLLLVWYHWRINRLLPLELTAEQASWVNFLLRKMRGGSSLGQVDPASPPRYLIPLWVEGGKFYFWTLITALILLVEERRRHFGYLMTLRVMLALQVTGMAIWDNPFAPPLPQFHQEVLPFFAGAPREQVFMGLYPRMVFFYNASYMWIHPPLLFIGYATLAATFAASLFTFRGIDPGIDRSGYEYAKLGYLLLTFGMLVGYPWAIMAWGPNWWWDPKIAASIMMWLLYSAYLHHRFVMHTDAGRRQTAALGVLCYASLLFTYFMSWFFPGEHTF